MYRLRIRYGNTKQRRIQSMSIQRMIDYSQKKKKKNGNWQSMEFAVGCLTIKYMWFHPFSPGEIWSAERKEFAIEK